MPHDTAPPPSSDWKIFVGDGAPHDGIGRLPDPPPWRTPGTWRNTRGATWQPGIADIELVNAALYLRRPLLVTGPPGSGKTSLAYAVAAELGLGTVLEWPVNSRSTLTEGKYLYDAVARLRDLTIAREAGQKVEDALGKYLRLGPLGTALATSAVRKPRVLLIDEIDKADVDFPNDLLHVLENGDFDIPEIQRAGNDPVAVRTSDDRTFEVKRGRIEAVEFPFVVITSNGERDLPPAFLRRCLRLDVRLPEGEQLVRILEAHLGITADTLPQVQGLIDRYAALTKGDRVVATDQLLNAVFLVARGHVPGLPEMLPLREALLRELGKG